MLRISLTLALLATLLGVPLTDVAAQGEDAPRYTGDSLYYLRPVDTLLVAFDAASGFILQEHYLAPGQTLYGTARFYGLGETEVYHLNAKLRAGYEAGDKVRVPLPPKLIRREPAPDSLAWFVPVRYRMGPGETLWGLTNRRLPQLSAEDVTNMNPGVAADRLSRGQILNVGYLKLDGISPDAQAEVEDPYVRRNRGLRNLWENRTQGKQMRTQNGKAAWTKKGDPNKFMVLHRTAPINSLIEIDDPRSRKVLYARVMGRIPESIYPPDVIVVVSPLLAKAYGVRDKQFYVRTRHF